jgi:phage recombination protein Bet
MKKKQRKKQRRAKTSAHRPTSTAIVKAAPAPITHWKERRFTQEQIDLLKRTVARNTDNDQFTLFMQVCQKHGLDPFVKEVYCVLFHTDKHHKDDKGIWVGGYDMVIITGIGGYRKMAARDHKDYAGSSDATFTWYEPKQFTPAKPPREIPRSATVRIHRRGSEDTISTVYWDEFAPADLSHSRSDFWRRMPCNQLEKCAEAKGLRKAFPGMGDVFVEEEMQQKLQDLTPNGRQIVQEDGTAPSGAPVTRDARNRQLKPPSAAFNNAALTQEGFWCAKHQCQFSKCPSDEHTQAELEAMDLLERAAKKKAEPAIDVTPSTKAVETKENADALKWKQEEERRRDEAAKLKPAAKKPEAENVDIPKATPIPKLAPGEYKFSLVIDWNMDAQAPVLTGDLEELGVAMSKAAPPIKMIWGKDEFWHCAGKDVPAVMQIAGQNAFFVKELHHGQIPQAGKHSSAPPASRKPAALEGGGAGKPAPAAVSTEPYIMEGFVEQTVPEMTKGAPAKDGKKPRPSVPYLRILFKTTTKHGKFWTATFDSTLFPILEKAKVPPVVCKLWMKDNKDLKYGPNIVGVQWVGAQEYVDMKIPVVQNEGREPGKTLF